MTSIEPSIPSQVRIRRPLPAPRPPGFLYNLQRNWISLVSATLALLLVGGIGYAVISSQRVRWSLVGHYFFSSQILAGIEITLLLTAVSMTAGTLLAVILAVMRLSDSRVLASLATVYLWFFRGTPLLVQLVFWYNIALFVPQVNFGFTTLQINQLISPLTAAITALTLNAAAYQSEIVRAGILSIDGGQGEAASALGLTRGQRLVRVILPQAVRVMVPPTANLTIDMLKATSLVSVIGTSDLLTHAQTIYSQNFNVIELLIVALLWYLVMVSIATYLQSRIEKHLGKSVVRASNGGSQL
jgi:polar amino acid transport system permease protein